MVVVVVVVVVVIILVKDTSIQIEAITVKVRDSSGTRILIMLVMLLRQAVGNANTRDMVVIRNGGVHGWLLLSRMWYRHGGSFFIPRTCEG